MLGEWLLAAAGNIKVTCEEIGNCSAKTPTISAGFANIANTMVFLVGSLAIIFVIVSGIQMALSMGNPKRVEQARQSLLYSVVGVIVAIMAYAIVTFIAGAL